MKEGMGAGSGGVVTPKLQAPGTRPSAWRSEWIDRLLLFDHDPDGHWIADDIEHR
jgi:hypothetical protein